MSEGESSLELNFKEENVTGEWLNILSNFKNAEIVFICCLQIHVIDSPRRGVLVNIKYRNVGG